MATLLPNGEQQFFDNDGNPLSLGSVYFYIPLTLTPKDTWQDSGQSILNTNPVVLDAAGRAIIYGTGAYRQIVKDSLGNTIWDEPTADTAGTGAFSWAGTSGGTANAQTVTASNFSSQDGQQIGFIAGLTNTGALTLNPNGVGPLGVRLDGVSGPIAMQGGEVRAGDLYLVTYDSSLGAFHVLSSTTNLNLGNLSPAVTVASAATTNILGAAAEKVIISGTVTITSLGTGADRIRLVTASGAFTLTYNATTLITPQAQDLKVAAGATFTVTSDSSSNATIREYQAPSGATSLPANIPLGTQCPYQALVVTWASNATLTVAATSVILFDTNGSPKPFAALSATPNITTSGANGLDTGSEASGTWYHLFAIGKADGTVATLFSISATAPTLPTGYIFKGYLGAVYNNGSSNFIVFKQLGNIVTAANSQPLSSGTQTSYTPVSLTASVPSTARSARLLIVASVSSGTATTTMRLAPEGATTTATYEEIIVEQGGGIPIYNAFEMPLTTAQQVVYYVAGANARGDLFVNGWIF